MPKKNNHFKSSGQANVQEKKYSPWLKEFPFETSSDDKVVLQTGVRYVQNSLIIHKENAYSFVSFSSDYLESYQTRVFILAPFPKTLQNTKLYSNMNEHINSSAAALWFVD